MESYIHHILKHFPKERVLTDEINLLSYSYDASFYTLKPSIIVRPVTIQEIQYLFEIANKEKVPITIRAAGTSLSGQSVGKGILCDISHHWKNYKILDSGSSIILEPGIIGSTANSYLKPYFRKIGPDPASINSCMMGGILANNASGMCCGVSFNSYHTLKNIKAVLADGYILNTFESDCDEKLKIKKKELYEKLLEIRNRILNGKGLYEKIRNKYKIKNTTGYSLNAFIDFEKPSEILAHLLIGSEGTLGFIAEAELKTIEDGLYKYTGLLCFQNIFDACEIIPYLIEHKAVAVELMDRASLRSVENKKNIPDFIKNLSEEATALLVEFESNNEKELEILYNNFINHFDFSKTVVKPYFTKIAEERSVLWNIRKGLFPSVGAVREAGTTVIIEDIAFPLENLPYATIELQKLFKKHNYNNAIIFGHAKDGNLHFVIKQSFNTKKQIEQYDYFMKDVVDLVVKRFNGSLKAEHGTGRNMAPFVETEWGKDLYEIMKEIKEIIDPNNILNPGVIINEDPNAHIQNIKNIPILSQINISHHQSEILDKTDKCIECGFCESVCPSQYITTTPRKRIILARESLRNPELYKNHEKDFDYYFYDTCVKCGACEIPCPVEINTGSFVKLLANNKNQNTLKEKIAILTTHYFSSVERLLRIMLSLGNFASKILSPNLLYKITQKINKKIRIPVYLPVLPKGSRYSRLKKKFISENNQNIEYYYFPTCISRIYGSQKEYELWMLIPFIAKELNIKIQILDTTGYCCSQPYESKSYFSAQKVMIQKTKKFLEENIQNPSIPIIIDNSSCTYSFIKNFNYHFIDSIEWIKKIIDKYPHKFGKFYNKIYIHNLCSVQKLNLEKQMISIGKSISQEVAISSQCCGFAGDKGIFFPEVNETITKKIKNQINYHNGKCDIYLSSNYPCELGLQQGTGYPFHHILYTIYEVIKKID